MQYVDIILTYAYIYTQQNFLEEVKRITNNVGVDVVYDSVGKDTWEGNRTILNKIM